MVVFTFFIYIRVNGVDYPEPARLGRTVIEPWYHKHFLLQELLAQPLLTLVCLYWKELGKNKDITYNE